MPVYYGDNKIKEIYYGNDKIGKIYYGDDLVYSSGPEGESFVIAKMVPNGTTEYGGQLYDHFIMESKDGINWESIRQVGSQESVATYCGGYGTWHFGNASYTKKSHVLSRWRQDSVGSTSGYRYIYTLSNGSEGRNFEETRFSSYPSIFKDNTSTKAFKTTDGLVFVGKIKSTSEKPAYMAKYRALDNSAGLAEFDINPYTARVSNGNVYNAGCLGLVPDKYGLGYNAVSFMPNSNGVYSSGYTRNVSYISDPGNGKFARVDGPYFGCQDVKFINNEFILVSNTGVIATSTDLSNWVEIPFEGITDLDYVQEITYCFGAYWIVNNDGTELYKSTDKVHWTNVTPTQMTSNEFPFITHNDYVLMLNNGNGEFLVSNDGESFTYYNLGTGVKTSRAISKECDVDQTWI